MRNHAKLIEAMTQYERGCPERIQHFMKVHGFARAIAELEGLEGEIADTLEAAAIVHDIGIKPSIIKYGDDSGPHQEAEGPEPARRMLEENGYSKDLTNRVCELVGRHHTYSAIDGLDNQILVEADFLVNLFENGLSKEAAQTAYQKIFVTGAGRRFCREMFALSI